MTLNTGYTSNKHIGNGVSTEFTYDFESVYEGSIKVYLRVDGAIVEQTEGFTYTWSSNGGIVTFEVPPVSGQEVVIGRVTEDSQEVPLKTSQGFQATVIEKAFDKLTAIAQENKEDIARCITLDKGIDADEFNLTLPVPDAGKALMWNADGSALVTTNTNIDDLESTVAETLRLAQEARDESVEASQESEASAILSANQVELAKQEVAKATAEVESATAQADRSYDEAERAKEYAESIDPESLKVKTVFSINEASKDASGNPDFVSVSGNQITFNGAVKYTQANGDSKNYASVSPIALEKTGFTPWVQPVLTSNSSNLSMVVSNTNSADANNCFKMFDGNDSTYFLAGDETIGDEARWVRNTIKFGTIKRVESVFARGDLILNVAAGLGGIRVVNADGSVIKEMTFTQQVGQGTLVLDEVLETTELFVELFVSGSLSLFPTRIVSMNIMAETERYKDGYVMLNNGVASVVPALEVQQSEPTSPVAQTVWFNPYNNQAKQFNGTDWVDYNGVPVGKIYNEQAINFYHNTYANLLPELFYFNTGEQLVDSYVNGESFYDIYAKNVNGVIKYWCEQGGNIVSGVNSLLVEFQEVNYNITTTAGYSSGGYDNVINKANKSQSSFSAIFNNSSLLFQYDARGYCNKPEEIL